jgi:hypothetical protein
LAVEEEEAAWRAVRGARSASMSKPGKSIALVKVARGCLRWMARQYYGQELDRSNIHHMIANHVKYHRTIFLPG